MCTIYVNKKIIDASLCGHLAQQISKASHSPQRLSHDVINPRYQFFYLDCISYSNYGLIMCGN